jgi:hypothetical protein
MPTHRHPHSTRRRAPFSQADPPHLAPPRPAPPDARTHHRVRIVDVDVVVLPADGLLHKRLLDAHAVQFNIVLRLQKAGRVGGPRRQAVARNHDMRWHRDGGLLGSSGAEGRAAQRGSGERGRLAGWRGRGGGWSEGVGRRGARGMRGRARAGSGRGRGGRFFSLLQNATRTKSSLWPAPEGSCRRGGGRATRPACRPATGRTHGAAAAQGHACAPRSLATMNSVL